MFVADIMTKNVHTIHKTETLEAINSVFNKVKYRHLLVQEDDLLIGIVSDRDMLGHLSPFLGCENETEQDRAVLKLPAAEIMSTTMITVDAETTIDTASILLLENTISCLPVVDEDNHIEGIVSWKDILEYHVYGVDSSLENDH